ncbi:hypothetical protein MTO96_018496 [Rhipicephalus appendiculatus]
MSRARGQPEQHCDSCRFGQNAWEIEQPLCARAHRSVCVLARPQAACHGPRGTDGWLNTGVGFCSARERSCVHSSSRAPPSLLGEAWTTPAGECHAARLAPTPTRQPDGRGLRLRHPPPSTPRRTHTKPGVRAEAQRGAQEVSRLRGLLRRDLAVELAWSHGHALPLLQKPRR